jgi:DNA-binding IscR family transcriptional regulator
MTEIKPCWAVQIGMPTAYATLGKGLSDSASVAEEMGISEDVARALLLMLAQRGSARWDKAIGGYVPAGTARSIRAERVVAL